MADIFYCSSADSQKTGCLVKRLLLFGFSLCVVYGVYCNVGEKGTASVFRFQFQADFEVTWRRKIISHMGQFEGI